MNVSVDQRVLTAAIHDVYSAAQANSPIPILAGIKLHASEQGLFLTGCNLHMTLQAHIVVDEVHCQIARTGSVVLPAKSLYETVRKLSPGSLELENDPSWRVTIRTRSTVCRLSGMNAASFPIAEVPEGNSISLTLNLPELKRAIGRVAFAAPQDENRPQLTGVSFRFAESGRLELMATNGVRLASDTVSYSTANRTIGIRSAVVPGQYASRLAHLPIDSSGMCRLTLTDRYLAVQTETRSMQSALLTGSYPHSAAVAHANCKAEITLDAQPLADALERATLLAGSTKTVHLFSGERSSLRLYAHSDELGDIDEELPVIRAAGERFSIHCNGVYLKEIVRAAQCEAVTLRIGGPLEPLRVLPVADPACFYLLSPIRANVT